MSNVEHFPLMIADASNMHATEIPLEVRSPYDEQLLATVAMVNAEGVEQALTHASQLFANRDAWIPIDQRIAILERMIVLLHAKADELALGASLEGGKPLMDSRIEMARCIDSIRICIDTLRTDTAHPPVMGINAASRNRVTLIQKEPIGVVVAVSAAILILTSTTFIF